ncbi:hypothetical protein E2R53_00610 [Peribacillus frigoritolerans]|nr:hypothetical protein E2R53_00610 [Peribacillus frigoritolerans]
MAKIYFQSVHVNQIQNSSGLFYGENFQYKWTNKSRMHEGFGRIRGNSNKIHHNITVAETQDKKADDDDKDQH